MMVVYVPGSGKKFPAMIFVRTPFDGCFGDRAGSMCSWMIPGTWPEWML
jgi:hypothetical protein